MFGGDGVSRAEDGAKPAPRPAYNPLLRQNENWSTFDPKASGADGIDGFLDSLKHIDLGDNSETWLSVGGSARARFENFENFGFGEANDDDYVLTRALVHADLHVNDQFRVFVEGKSAFSTDRDLPGGQRTLDVDSAAVQQAFADFKFDTGNGGTLTVRGGRQMLAFGNQRLVSPLPWGNTLRAWDGVSLIYKQGGWVTHGFWTQFVPVQKYDANTSDRQTQFFGVYATGPLDAQRGIKSDIYFLGLDQSDSTNTFNGTTGAERRYTVGGRLFGKVGDGPWDYDAEAAYQFGDLGGADINAWMFAGELGYALGGEWGARAFLGLDYASGDDSAGGDVETFNQLFPLGHAFLGYIDVIGRQNIIDTSLGLSVKPVEKMGVRVAGHFFWLASDDDALYNAGGGVVRASGLATDNYVGAEIDVTVDYKINRQTTLLLGYSHFFAGDFIDNATPAANEDTDFVYTQLQWVF